MLLYSDNLLSFVALQEKIMRLVGSNQDFMESDSPNRSHMSLLTPKNLEDRFGHLLKMASLLAVQRLISTHIFFVDPFSMAYGRSKYDKKLVSDLSFLSYSKKMTKSEKNSLFFTDFWS